MHILVLTQLPVAHRSFCWSKQTRPSVGVLGRHSGVFWFSRLCRRFSYVASSAGRCCSSFPFLVFSAAGISSVFERVTSVDSVSCLEWRRQLTLAMSGILGREGKTSRTVGLQHPMERTLSLVLSLRVDRHQSMRLQCFLVPVR